MASPLGEFAPHAVKLCLGRTTDGMPVQISVTRRYRGFVALPFNSDRYFLHLVTLLDRVNYLLAVV